MVEFEKPEATTPLQVEQAALYQRLQDFSLDRSDSPFSFSQRLAKENNWPRGFADRAIAEYKKFAFLAVVAGHPVTPSDQVDQVWHLHLTYTRSYWEEFCTQVLQKPLHHEPTQGGTAESQKFEDWYEKTLESYQHWFGEQPPADLWPPAAVRFGRDSRFVRVNVQQNWVLPKPKLKLPDKTPQRSLLFFASLFILTGCEPIAALPNPLNFPGPEFLTFYVLLMAIVLPFSLWLRHLLRLPAQGPPVPNLAAYDVAYLAGGQQRVVETALTSLVQQNFVTVLPEERHLELLLDWVLDDVLPTERRLELIAPIARSWHPIEQAVAAAVKAYGGIGQIRSSVGLNTETLHDRLRQLNLVLSPTQVAKARFYPLLLTLALLGLGVAKIVVGVSRDKPVGLLVVLCFIVIIWCAGLAGSPLSDRTRHGDRTLAKLRDQMWSLKRDASSLKFARTGRISGVNYNLAQSKSASNDDQLPMLFALFGIEVLAGGFTDLRSVLQPPPSVGGGSGDSGGGGGCGGGGCGGGGCGGGGCGGCGG